MLEKNTFKSKYMYEDFTSIRKSEFNNPKKIVIAFIKFYKEYLIYKSNLLKECNSAGLKVISDYCSSIGNKKLAKESFDKLNVEYKKSCDSEIAVAKLKSENENNWFVISLVEKIEKLLSLLGFILALFFEYLIRNTVLKEIPFAYYNPIVGAAMIWYLGRVFLEDYPERIHNYIWWKLFDSITLKINCVIESLDDLYKKESTRLELIAKELIKINK